MAIAKHCMNGRGIADVVRQHRSREKSRVKNKRVLLHDQPDAGVVRMGWVEEKIQLCRFHKRGHPKSKAASVSEPLHTDLLSCGRVDSPVCGQPQAFHIKQRCGIRYFQAKKSHVFGRSTVAMHALLKLAQCSGRPKLYAIRESSTPGSKCLPM